MIIYNTEHHCQKTVAITKHWGFIPTSNTKVLIRGKKALVIEEFEWLLRNSEKNCGAGALLAIPINELV